MATYTTQPGPFNWNPALPDNINPGDEISSAKTLEITDNADTMEGAGVEACFNEKLTQCTDARTTRKTSRYDTYRESNYSALYTTRKDSDRSYRDLTARNAEYDYRRSVYYGDKCGNYYADAKMTKHGIFGCGAEYIGYMYSKYSTNHNGRYVPYHSGNNATYHSTLNISQRVSVDAVEHNVLHSNRDTTVHATNHATEYNTNDPA